MAKRDTGLLRGRLEEDDALRQKLTGNHPKALSPPPLGPGVLG